MDLTLTGCCASCHHIKKLFSRIITPLFPQNTTLTVLLRSLTIRPKLPKESIYTILSLLPNIVSILATQQLGAHLRTLYISSPQVSDTDTKIPAALLRLCPNLIQFTYHCEHLDESVLSSLPSTLTVLELSVGNNTYGRTPWNVSCNFSPPTFLAWWLRDVLRWKRSAPGLCRVTANVSGKHLCDMWEILEDTQPEGSVPAGCFTHIDICLEGETLEVTPS